MKACWHGDGNHTLFIKVVIKAPSLSVPYRNLSLGGGGHWVRRRGDEAPELAAEELDVGGRGGVLGGPPGHMAPAEIHEVRCAL